MDMLFCPQSMLFESIGRDKGILNAEFAGMGRGTHGKMCCWPLTAEHFSWGHPSEWEGCLLETAGWGQAGLGWLVAADLLELPY